MKSYHNTTDSSGQTLIEYNQKAETQEQKILQFFQENRGSFFTPSEIHEYTYSRNTPLTSIRRAISNLTRQGFLIKTTEQRQGYYDRPEYIWRLA